MTVEDVHLPLLVLPGDMYKITERHRFGKPECKVEGFTHFLPVPQNYMYECQCQYLFTRWY